MPSLVTLLAGLLLALGAGRLVVTRLGLPVAWPMTTAIGVAAMTQALHGVALAGLLRPRIVLMLGAVVVVLGWASRTTAPVQRLDRGHAWRRRLVVAAIVVVSTSLLTLYPPLGYDQTMYHLPMARAFAATGGVPILPSLRYPAFPAMAEVLSATVLLWADDVTTQVVGWLALVALLALTWQWACDLAVAQVAWLASAALVGSPIVVYLAATGYVEPLLGLLVTGSLVAATRARDVAEHSGPGSSSHLLAWTTLAGAMAGTAAGVKYLGLLAIPAAACVLWPRLTSTRDTARTMAMYALAACLASAPTYARLVALTGNPLHPFYGEVFGQPAWDATPYLGPTGAERLTRAATFLWDAVFRRDLVGGLPHWSPVFLVAVPLAAIAASSVRHAGRLVVVAALWMAIAPIHAHYFLAIAPVWAVLAGIGAGQLARRWPRLTPALGAAALLVALGGPAYTGFLAWRLGPPPRSVSARESLLAAHLPLYRAVRAMDGDAPVVAYGVGAARMADYVRGTLVGDIAGPVPHARVLARAAALGSLGRALDEIGATHLLLAAGVEPWTTLAAQDAWLSRVHGDAGGLVYRVSRR